jgi:hypothetical protein
MSHCANVCGTQNVRDRQASPRSLLASPKPLRIALADQA